MLYSRSITAQPVPPWTTQTLYNPNALSSFSALSRDFLLLCFHACILIKQKVQDQFQDTGREIMYFYNYFAIQYTEFMAAKLHRPVKQPLCKLLSSTKYQLYWNSFKQYQGRGILDWLPGWEIFYYYLILSCHFKCAQVCSLVLVV